MLLNRSKICQSIESSLNACYSIKCGQNMLWNCNSDTQRERKTHHHIKSVVTYTLHFKQLPTYVYARNTDLSVITSVAECHNEIWYEHIMIHPDLLTYALYFANGVKIAELSWNISRQFCFCILHAFQDLCSHIFVNFILVHVVIFSYIFSFKISDQMKTFRFTIIFFQYMT